MHNAQGINENIYYSYLNLSVIYVSILIRYLWMGRIMSTPDSKIKIALVTYQHGFDEEKLFSFDLKEYESRS